MRKEISTISLIFAAAACLQPAAAGSSEISSGSKKAASANGLTKLSSVEKQSASIKGGTKKHSSRSKSVFVPPPPPVVPTLEPQLMPGTAIYLSSENIEYLPAADLKELKEKTGKEIAQLRRAIEELIVSASEKKQRADSFDELFAEGVVSKRELEQSKIDNDKASQDLSESKQNLKALENKFARIERRLSEISKAAQSGKKGVSSNKKAGQK